MENHSLKSKNKKRILLTNDDGVNSSGLFASKEAVGDLGEVSVVAPYSQQSAIGRGLTLFHPLRLNNVFLKDNTHAYSVSGTPADSVVLGVFEIMEGEVDLAISGINIGHNTGRAELTTSGTISAAMEAASYGIDSMAVSLQVERDSVKFDNEVADFDFDLAKSVVRKLAKKILKQGLPKGVDLINVNIPSKAESNEIILANLAERMYHAKINKRNDPRGKPYYWIDGERCEDYVEGTDLHAIDVLKMPSLTPLSIGCSLKLDSIKDWLK